MTGGIAGREAVTGIVELHVDALLFDMDGTLVDSVLAVEASWALWAEEMGLPAPDLSEHHGRTAAAIAADLLPAAVRPEGLRRIEEIESDPAQPCSATPGALELLSALPSDRWGIVTSAGRPVALARLKASGIGVPTAIITGDQVERGKPDPEPFRRGRRSTGAAEGVVLAFEDTVTGLRSARAAGCTTIGILGTESRERLSGFADLVIEDLTRVHVERVDDTGVRVRVDALERTETER